jgi:nitrogen-specific signal transduction histidine kinase/CheY-like chemotaxis protein
VAVKRDITEHLRLEEEKERLEDEVERGRRLESIGRLAGGVAHDLNNLLSPILGYGELLMLDLVGDEESLDSVREIVRAGERARTLVAQLLAFSRRQLLEFRPVDLNAILGEFENLLRRTIREDVELRICPDPDLPLVRADAGQLEQVIMNLAVNAQDAMPEGGVLVLETGVLELSEAYAALHDNMRPGKYVQLSVSDTGCGMDEETRARIFEPFFTTKGQEHGTGLGLATVYGIVKQHGGDIWVYSEPGHGCTFKIYLPVDRGAGAMVAETEETSGPTGGNETILLAEDDRQVRGLASAVLEREGYTVLAACGGEHALRLVREHSGPIDILLTDVVMPDINGRVLYEKLAKACPDLKVIYMSGYTDNVIAHHGIIEDDVNFLQKPFNVKLLARQVRRVLDA